MRNALQFWLANRGDIPLTISMCSGEDNIKKGLNETGHTNVEWIELDQDRFQKNSLERPFY
jgi:hypothetical protein